MKSALDRHFGTQFNRPRKISKAVVQTTGLLSHYRMKGDTHDTANTDLDEKFLEPARTNPPTRHHTMKVRMEKQVLSPTVQHGEKADFRPEVFGISGDGT